MTKNSGGRGGSGQSPQNQADKMPFAQRKDRPFVGLNYDWLDAPEGSPQQLALLEREVNRIRKILDSSAIANSKEFSEFLNTWRPMTAEMKRLGSIGWQNEKTQAVSARLLNAAKTMQSQTGRLALLSANSASIFKLDQQIRNLSVQVSTGLKPRSSSKEKKVRLTQVELKSVHSQLKKLKEQRSRLVDSDSSTRIGLTESNRFKPYKGRSSKTQNRSRQKAVDTYQVKSTGQRVGNKYKVAEKKLNDNRKPQKSQNSQASTKLPPGVKSVDQRGQWSRKPPPENWRKQGKRGDD